MHLHCRFCVDLVTLKKSNLDKFIETLMRVLNSGLWLISDPCASNPCLNGGICRKSEDHMFECICTLRFTGNICERPIGKSGVSCHL